MTDDRTIALGGDFARLFEPGEMNVLINTPDQVSCVLRAHLICEEFLTLYAEKVTGCDSIFEGGFIPFNTKLQLTKNLGLPADYSAVLGQINSVRNRFSHRRLYEMQNGDLESLADKIDALKSHYQMENCRKFHVEIGGVLISTGERQTKRYVWADSDARIRFLLLFSVLIWKLIYWIQHDLQARGISYALVDTIPGGAVQAPTDSSTKP